MNQNILFDTVTSIIDARRGGSSIDEITRVFAIDRDTAFSVIRREAAPPEKNQNLRYRRKN